jgi:hypothetical protein
MVGTMLLRRTPSFRRTLEYNFRSIVAKIRRRARVLDGAIIDRELAQHGTTLETCRDGETVHLSLMSRTSCPCSHQSALDATKPRTPDINLNLTDVTCELTITIERIERADGPRTHHEPGKQWKRSVVEHIQLFPPDSGVCTRTFRDRWWVRHGTSPYLCTDVPNAYISSIVEYLVRVK